MIEEPRPIASKGRARLETLDAIRGIAAMVVVVHHCFLSQPAFSDYFFSNWRTEPVGPWQFALFETPLRIVWDGFEAVTLFYVLSGIVLALPWVQGRAPAYGSYAIKRICRIYLPYLVAIGIPAALSAAHVFHAPVPGLSDWVNTMNWSHPVTFKMLADHVFMIGHQNNLNGVIHSLIWEMRVSLIFPLIVLPIVWWRMRGALAVTALITLVIGVLQLVFGGDRPWLGLLTSSDDLGVAGKLALEVQWTAYFCYFFVLGSVISLNLAYIQRRMSALSGWRSALLLIVALLLFQAHWSHAFVLQQAMVGLASALIILPALGTGAIARFLAFRPLVWLGEVSYSLYLVHVPLLLFSLLVLDGRVPPLVTLIALPPTAVVLAWLFHVSVARPCIALGVRLAAAPRRRAAAIGQAATLVPRHSIDETAAGTAP